MTAGRAADLFSATYGYRPKVIASAPGRVNLIGEHTDYNGGQVLPIAIGARTWAAMSPSVSGSSRAVSAQHGDSGLFQVASDQPAHAWWDYVHGTLRALAPFGVPLADVDVAVVSDVPMGAGLSSSAALEVAAALAGAVQFGAPLLDAWDHIAEVCHRAENLFVGVPCGVMDQTVSAYATQGHALRIWCATQRRAQVPFAQAVLVVDTVTPRALRNSGYATRRASCVRALHAVQRGSPDVRHLADATLDQLSNAGLSFEDFRRARHVVTEAARAERAIRALEAGEPLGALLYASHQSLRDDYECSAPELDWVVEFASRQPEVDGARLTGAGWGGCAIAVGTEDGLRTMSTTIGPAFRTRWGREPRTWLTHAEEGGDIDAVDGMEPFVGDGDD